MNIENHFKDFSDFENKIQNSKILKFVDFFEIKNLSNLKCLSAWNEIDDSALKKKIYNKVYYIEKKSKESGDKVEIETVSNNVNTEDSCIVEGLVDTSQIFNHKQKFSTLSYAYLAVIVSTLLFLMSESRLFYLSYGFSQFNSVLLPVLVEACILLLSIGNDLRSKLLMVLLVLYNIVSFSFYTVGEYEKEVLSIDQNIVKLGLFMEEKGMLQKEYDSIEAELSKSRNLYETAVKNKYVTRANELYLPRIASLEGRFKEVLLSYKALTKKISNINDLKSKKTLLVGVIALLFLKFALQLVQILFVRLLR
jgi:hypothetical protein